jgi:hypothetical protein
MAIRKIKLRRGLEINLPTLDIGEPGFTTDTKRFFIGSANGNIEYPTLEAVQALISNIDLDSLENLESLATIEYVDTTIGNIPAVDLTGLATETFVTNAISEIEIPSIEGLATEEYVTDAIAAIEIPTVPTDISELTDTQGLLGQGGSSIPGSPLFIVANSDGNISTSEDGETWTNGLQLRFNGEFLNGEGGGLNRVVLADNYVIYIADNEKLWYAPDTTSNPTEIQMPNNGRYEWNDIEYGDGMVVAVGMFEENDGEGGYLPRVPTYAFTTNGTSWSFMDQDSDEGYGEGFDGNSFTSVTWNGTGWLITASNIEADPELGGPLGAGAFWITETLTITNAINPDNYILFDAESEEGPGEIPNLDSVVWTGDRWWLRQDSDGPDGSDNTWYVSSGANPQTSTWSIKSINEQLGEFGISSTGFYEDAGGTINGEHWFVTASFNGHIMASKDGGETFVFSVPLPYTSTINITNGAVTTATFGTEGPTGSGEKIVVSNTGIPALDGTYFVKSIGEGVYELYTDYQLTVPFDSIGFGAPEVGTVLLNHGEYIDSVGFGLGKFIVGNDDEQLFSSTDLTTWTLENDQENDFVYWNDISFNENWGRQSSNAAGPIQPYLELTNKPLITLPVILGTPVQFTKTEEDSIDEIDEDLSLTRGSSQGLFNIELEEQYDRNTHTAPAGTLWNSDGWGDLLDVAQRSYVTLRESLDNAIGENIIGAELIMWDTANNKYYKFSFSNWEENGGGFSYTRTLIEENPNLFVKTDYGSEVDEISSGLYITRKNQGWLYNPLEESGHDDDTPTNSLWNFDGWDNFSNVTQKTYRTLRDIWGENFDSISGAKGILKDTTTNKYWAIQFLSWTSGQNGGGFSYNRYEIDLTKLKEGITFADGTILKSAAGIGRVKSTASGGRRIEEATGSKTVVVSEIVTNDYELTSNRTTNTNYEIFISRSIDSELDQLIVEDNNGNYNFTYYVSFDNITFREVYLSSIRDENDSEGPEYWFNYEEDGDNQSVQVQGNPVYLRIASGGEPVTWWDKNDLPGGGNDFRGAIIDYHAYVVGRGTIIGTIHIADDDGDEFITHTETSSGSDNLSYSDLWYVTSEGKIRYRQLDGSPRTLKVHWTAKVFYGEEYYD